MKKWITGKVIKAATGLAVTTVAVGALANASVLESIFVPDKFSKFKNEQENEQYRYAAGDGDNIELADKNGEQDKTSGDNQQEINQINQENPTNENNQADSVINVIDDNQTEDNSENKIAGTVSLTDSDQNAKVSLTQGKNNSGNTGTSNGNNTSSSSDSNTNSNGTSGDSNSTNNGSQDNSNNGNQNGNNNGNNSNPSDDNTPDTPDNPDNPDTPDTPDTPDEPQQSWEDIQLKPKDPVETEYGTLLSLSAEFIKTEYAAGESFSGNDATVTAVFSNSDGSTQTKELPYGTNGYQVSFSTATAGDRIAVFSYKGMSARAKYTVMYSYADIWYMAVYEGQDNTYYLSRFPGEPMQDIAGDDYEQLLKLIKFPNNYIEAGNIIDLSEVHSRMIAYLGNEIIKQKFQETSGGNYGTTVFLEQDEDGYLTTMLEGFRSVLGKELMDERSYIYYPAGNWESVSKNMLDFVTKVPDGYKVRRVTESEDKIADYRAEQVLEAYTGSSEVLEVPMGVTKIDLKSVSENVTSIKIPQSVTSVNAESLISCLPNLKEFEYEDEALTYKKIKIEDGLLYDGTGTTLLAVPGQKKEVTIPAKVTTLGKGCLKGLSKDSVVRFESNTVPKLEGETGYTGTIVVPASKYNTTGKRYFFAFGEESNSISFKTTENKTLPYVYDTDGPKLCYKEDSSILAAFSPDIYGKCSVGDGIREIADGAFIGCTKITDLELQEEVKVLREGSLVLPDNVKEITILASDLEVSPMVFGNPEDGAEVPNVKIYVSEDDYETYLEKWSASLDSVYGKGTAKKLLSKEQRAVFFENGAKYEEIQKNGTTGYRLIKLYEKEKTAFAVKENTIEIADDAFLEAENLEILYLPESVAEIGNALTNCTNLESVASENPEFDSESAVLPETAQLFVTGREYESLEYEDGVLYGKSEDGMYILLNVRTDYEETLFFKKQTRRVEKEACKDCSQVNDFYFLEPEVLEEIGEESFASCGVLDGVNFTNFTKLSSIGKGAFRNCTALLAVLFPESVTELPDDLFYGCESLQLADAPNVKTIGERTFYGCNSLTEVKDTENFETIGAQAFYGCSNLTEVTLGENLSSMGEECFENCTGLKKVVLNGKLTGISRYCFYGCNNLTNVVLGEQQKQALKVIGVQAFGECSYLETLDLSGAESLTKIGERAFSACQRLTTVDFPKELKKIPDYCFEDCTSLSIVRLSGETVPELGEKIFGETLPEFLHIWVEKEQLENYREAYETYLDELYGEGTTEETLGENNDNQEVVKGVLFELTEEGRVLKSASEKIAGDYLIPSDTVRIEAEAFMDCKELVEVKLPEGANTVFEDRCFKGCTALQKVDIAGTVTSWGEETFMDCTAVTKIYIGRDDTTMERIGTRAFKNCTGLSGEGAIELCGVIKTLGTECFAGCTNLPSIGLTTTSTTGIEVIEDSVFEDCTKLRVSLTSKYTGLKSIGNYAFRNCDSLKQPSIPANVTSIGEGCFMDCDNVTYVSFYGAVEEYPKDCFRNCPNLIRTGGTAAAFAGLKRIGEHAYDGCTSLTASSSWNLGRYANLEEIGDFAFNGCSTLADSTLSATVTKLGNNSFDGCTSLNRLTLEGLTPPQMGLISPDKMAEGFLILVPDSQESGDSIYLAYREQLSNVIGEEMAYQILDSVSDGAKERNPLPEKASEPDKASEDSKDTETASEGQTEEKKDTEAGSEDKTGDKTGESETTNTTDTKHTDTENAGSKETEKEKSDTEKSDETVNSSSTEASTEKTDKNQTEEAGKSESAGTAENSQSAVKSDKTAEVNQTEE